MMAKLVAKNSIILIMAKILCYLSKGEVGAEQLISSRLSDNIHKSLLEGARK